MKLLKRGKHDASLELREQNLPKSLFRYRPCSEQNFQTLERGTVWLSPPDKQNDPHDSRLSLVGGALNSLFQSVWPTLLGLSRSELEEAELAEDFSERCIEILNTKYRDVSTSQTRKVISAMAINFHEVVIGRSRALALVPSQFQKISCFTTDVTSSQMWAYYAGGHTGYCIEYPYEGMQMSDFCARWLYPVIYSDKRFNLWTVFKMSRRGTALIHWFTLTAMHKGSQWTHEQEWRIIAPPDYKHNEFQMPWPSGIYLGNKIKPKDKQRLISIVAELEKNRGLPIPIYEMSASGTDYSLLPVRVRGT